MSGEHEMGLPLNTFIVRFWRDSEAGQAYWRGLVQHIQSGERIAFADEATLLRFLRHWIEMKEPLREEHQS